jgi:hypothetical protein
VIIGLGAVLYLFGVPYVLDVALWVLAALTLFTAGQRIVHVYRQAAGARTPLAGAPRDEAGETDETGDAGDAAGRADGTDAPRDETAGQRR